jgi:apolipoprotein N-acyltransferase
LARALPPSLRGAALMPGAALAVHQLRYSIAFGSHAQSELTAQGHAYLSSLTPWIVLLATLAIGVSLGGLARRWAEGTGDAPARHPLLRTWLLAAVALVLVYTGQELLEGLFATGHPGGLVGIFGDGGLWAVPAAIGVGGIVALALHGGTAVVAALRPGRRRIALPRAPLALCVARAAAPFVALPRPLARAAAGRAPPRTPLTVAA